MRTSDKEENIDDDRHAKLIRKYFSNIKSKPGVDFATISVAVGPIFAHWLKQYRYSSLNNSNIWFDNLPLPGAYFITCAGRRFYFLHQREKTNYTRTSVIFPITCQSQYFPINYFITFNPNSRAQLCDNTLHVFFLLRLH